MKKSILFSALLFAFSLVAQESKKQILGQRLTETALFLDPTEVQMSGSITALTEVNMLENQYIPFSIGGAQSILGKVLSEQKAWEIFAEFAVFTQFEWTELKTGKQERNLINSDYKVALSYARKVNNLLSYRFRFFHLSSHLGDDYIIRNSIRKYTENKANYEQIEGSVFYHLSKNRQLNFGVGTVIRPNALRLPFSFHLGYNQELFKKENGWGLTYGAFLKGMQEHGFTPALKLGVGPAFYPNNKKEPLRIIFEYYKGNLPYSQYEFNKTEWLGLGVYFYL